MKCDCGNEAVWLYMPNGMKGNNYFCEDCVPRVQCSCNEELKQEYICNIDEEYEIYIKEHWIPILDKQGRLIPCEEFVYIGED